MIATTANYVVVSEVQKTLRATLVIDPTLFVPDFLRPPLLISETKETQSNLRLESRQDDIYADITLPEHVDNLKTPSIGKRRARMHMKSSQGNITSIIVSNLSRTQRNI